MATILIVEDDPHVAAFLEKGLESGGFSTVLVDNGEQALSFGLNGGIGLLILDTFPTARALKS